MRMSRSGNASPGHGEVPGPIPGIRSHAALANRQRRCAQTAEDPGPNPGGGTDGERREGQADWRLHLS